MRSRIGVVVCLWLLLPLSAHAELIDSVLGVDAERVGCAAVWPINVIAFD